MSRSESSSAEQETTSPPEVLLDAAFRVFATRGYRSTRLEEVAEEAGLTKGAIYYHFDGKEDLLRRAVQHRHATVFAEMQQELEALRAPSSVKIRHVLRRLWQHLMEPSWGYAFRLMFGEVGLEFPAFFRMWVEEGPIQGWSILRDVVQSGVDSGEFRRDVDPEVSARIIVSGLMLQAALQVHSSVADLAPCDVDRILDSAMELFLRGLVNRPEASPGR
ncbi:MAG: TetR/AcrR family transcriptional regulator [Gemmatimonadota bacterium]